MIVKKSNYVQSLQSLGGPSELQHKANKYKFEYTFFIHINEINFVMEGHWTPTFMSLAQSNDMDNVGMEDNGSANNESTIGEDFFHRNKSFSIVTNTFKTFELVCFHPSTMNQIVKTLRSVIYQSSMQAKTLAIFAKANRKYMFSQQQKRRIGNKNTLPDLEFDTFVAMFENGIIRIENSTGVKIPYTALQSEELTTTVLFEQIKQTQLLLNQWSEWIDNYLINWVHHNGLLTSDIDIPTTTASDSNTAKKIVRQNSRSYDRNSLATDDNYVLFENVDAINNDTFAYQNVDSNVDPSQNNCLVM